MTNHAHPLRAVVGLAVGLGLVSTTHALDRFDRSVEGWRAGPATTVSFVPDQGNPGGHLLASDAGVPDMTIVAPSRYHGDQRAHDGGLFVLDARFFHDAPDGCLPSFGVVRITGAGITVAHDLVPTCPASACWTRWSAPLIAEAWGVQPARWAEILGDVQDITIEVESVVHDEMDAFDNIGFLANRRAIADLDGDGVVAFGDLLIILARWGPCGRCCIEDLDGNGLVDFRDILMLLGAWGATE